MNNEQFIMHTHIQERISKIQNGEVPEGYQKTKVGVIPDSWSVRKLQDIAPLQRGFDLPKQQLVPGHYPVAYSNGILNHHVEFKVPGPGVFTGRSGTIGKVFYVDDDYWPHNTTLWVTDFKGNNPKFIYYFYQSVNLLRFNAGTSVPTLNRNDVHIAKAPLPPLPEQQKIAEILSAWDDAIRLQHELIEQKTAQKRGLMQMLLSGKIRVTEMGTLSPDTIKKRVADIQQGVVPEGYQKTKLGVVPKEWIVQKAKYIFRNHTNKSHNGELEVLSATQARGVIPRSLVDIDIKYDPKSLKSYKKVEKGDFVISLRSFQGGIEYSLYEGLVSPAYTILKNIVQINDFYYSQLFKTQSFITRLNSIIYGIRDGKQIGYKDFCELYLQYPPVEEQQQIADILTTADKEIELLETELAQLHEQKKGLMQLLLTGTIRVTEVQE